MKENLKSRWLMILFALPFAGGGIGILLMGVIPNLYEWQHMKSWPEVRAHLAEAGLTTTDGDDIDTYRATARYHYVYQGTNYTGERVAIMGGSDNIGDFQQQLAARLEAAHQNQQPVPAWVNPNNPGEAVLNRDMRWGMLGFKLIFVLVFGGVGVGLLIATLMLKPDATHHPEGESKPWLAQRQWASPRIACNAKAGVWGIWVFALIWNLVSLPATLAIPEQLSQGNTTILIALLFPAAGVLLLFWAIKNSLSWRRFGQLHLELDPYPGSIGGQVGGTIDLPLPYNSKQRFPVTLMCLRSFESGSGKNRRREENLIWQCEGLAYHQAGAQGQTRLSLCFDVPSNLPASEPFASSYRLWRVQLKADLPGVDLNREFEIPVFATHQHASTTIPSSQRHPQLREARAAQLEAIANIEQIPGGVRLFFPMFRNPGNELIGLFVGLAFGATGVLLLNEHDVPAFMAWLFTLLGGIAFFSCLKSIFSSLLVQLNQDGLVCKRLWLGVIIGKDQVPHADIANLQLGLSYRSKSAEGHTEMYNIYALTRSGKKIRIAMNLKGRDTAQMALDAIGSLSGYRTR